MNRRGAAIGLVLFAALAGVLAGPASPAYAHAQLVGTTPANGARLDSAPAEIVLRFSERVLIVRDGVRLLNAAGTVAGAGPARNDPTGREVILPVPPGLGDGVYTVTWRVISADSHPLHGAFAFGVGDTEAVPILDGSAQANADSGVTTVYWLFRWLGYAGLALLAGGALFLFACWPAGWAQRRAHRLLVAGWVTSVLSALAVLLIQGPYANGGTLGDLADPAVVAGTFGTDFGRFVAVRLMLLAIAAALLFAVIRRGQSPQWRIWATLGAALPVTWIGTGHANADTNPLVWLADGIHLAAMAAWFGGLVFLVAALLPASAGQPVTEVSAAVTRFSRIATVCVGLLVVTGTFQAWRGVGSFEALAGSGYGRLLVFKLAVIGVLLWFGWMSRNLVRRRYMAQESTVVAAPATVAEPAMAGGPRHPARPSRTVRRTDRAERERESLNRKRLRWSVGIEAAIGVTVLAITAQLVATPPGARPAAALGAEAPAAASPTPPPEIVATQLSLSGGGRLYIQLEPARVGDSTLVLAVLDSSSKPWDVPEVTATLSHAGQRIGPLPVSLRKVRPGEYTSNALVVPMAGTWQLQVKVRTTDIDQITAEAVLPVYQV